MLFKRNTTRIEKAELRRLRQIDERAYMLDTQCGVGLWDALLPGGDAAHPDATVHWSAEMRRILGYESTADFPDLMSAWTDSIHPDDKATVFGTFSKHVKDRTLYEITYRLKKRDGSYRWFRATGDFLLKSDGISVFACGSLLDVHDEVVLKGEIEQKAREATQTIDVLRSALAKLAAGDLRYRVVDPLPIETKQLGVDFNVAAENLGAIVRSAFELINLMVSETRNINQATNDLARRTETQAASLEETASAIEQITDMVELSAEGASFALSISSQAHEAANLSGSVVLEAVAAMDEIKGSSLQVQHIIQVIDEIAFQTNLLALNAGVEAARAGEAGNGFAVVAQEVRELAQRSARAAREIQELITKSSRQVEKGVALVGRTGAALKEIADKVTEINRFVTQFASSSKEQASGIGEINSVINGMDHITQQNAAMAEETSAASNSLTHNMQDLRELIAELKFNPIEGGMPECIHAAA